MPPRASTSRTRWPFATPPIAGLQLICAMRSMFMVIRAVLRPMRAAAIAASHPACPAPTTTTSYFSVKAIEFPESCYKPILRICEVRCSASLSQLARMGQIGLRLGPRQADPSPGIGHQHKNDGGYQIPGRSTRLGRGAHVVKIANMMQRADVPPGGVESLEELARPTGNAKRKRQGGDEECAGCPSSQAGEVGANDQVQGKTATGECGQQNASRKGGQKLARNGVRSR